MIGGARKHVHTANAVSECWTCQACALSSAVSRDTRLAKAASRHACTQVYSAQDADAQLSAPCFVSRPGTDFAKVGHLPMVRQNVE